MKIMWRRSAPFRLILLTVALAGSRAGGATDMGELRLAATDPGGRNMRDFEVRGGVLGMRGDSEWRAIPAGVVWRLEGNWRAAEGSFHFVPGYLLQRRELPDTHPDLAAAPFEAIVPVGPRAEAGWTAAQLRDGILIFAWLSEGNIVQISPVPLGSAVPREKSVVARVRFRLSPTQARGGPAVLLLGPGGWISPRPWFSNPGANRAIAAFHGGDATEIGAALAEPKLARLRGADGITLLHFAAATGCGPGVERLLLQGARPTARDDEARATPLEWAAGNGRVDIVVRLGRLASARERNEALRAAVRGGHTAAAQELIVGEAPMPDKELAARALEQGMVEVFSVLAGPEKEAATKSISPEIPMALAARGQFARASLLIAQGVDLKKQAAGALLLAATEGARELVRVLLSAGVAPDPAAADDIAPLALAARYGRTEVVETLLAAGANANRVDAQGRTALQLAVFSEEDGMAGRLLARGAHLGTDARGGRSPLHLALLWGAGSAAADLILAGARIDLTAPNAHAVLAAAIKLDAVELIARSMEDGWSPGTILDGKWHPSVVAEGYEANRVLELLQQRAAPGAGSGLGLVRDVDAFPIAIEIALPPDLRSPGRKWAQQPLQIRGVIDPAGTFWFPRVEGSEDHALCQAIAVASGKWRFRPALRRGEPVAARVTLPLLLSAEPQMVFDLSEVDSLPVQLLPVPPPTSQVTLAFPGAGMPPPYSMTDLWVGAADPDIRRIIADLMNGRTVAFAGVDSARAGRPDQRALVSFVITEDGRPVDVHVDWAATSEKQAAAIKAMQRYRYSPARVAGRAVQVPLRQWVRVQ